VERKETGDAIGYCGLTASGNGSLDEPELAYELLRATHGRGYATEAAHAVLVWARDRGYQRLWAGVWDWNVASRRVLEKLQFREVDSDQPASAYGQSLLTVRVFRMRAER
jgi:RimJ/RimL family protein N-acetyltransferase